MQQDDWVSQQEERVWRADRDLRWLLRQIWLDVHSMTDRLEMSALQGDEFVRCRDEIEVTIRCPGRIQAARELEASYRKERETLYRDAPPSRSHKRADYPLQPTMRNVRDVNALISEERARAEKAGVIRHLELLPDILVQKIADAFIVPLRDRSGRIPEVIYEKMQNWQDLDRRDIERIAD
jgi:hypothetical protein